MAHAVIERRRSERETLLSSARSFVDGLPAELAVQSAVVFGSVARGDFNLWSDVDLLLVAHRVSGRSFERLDRIQVPPRIQAIVWTLEEWRLALNRRNPIALECVERGVWLLGSAPPV